MAVWRWTGAALLLLAPPTRLAAQRPASTGEPWQIVSMPQSSQVLARDGSLVGEIGRQWRTIVPIKSLPRYVPQAFVAVEDQRFYQHDGVDLVGVAGALGTRWADDCGGQHDHPAARREHAPRHHRSHGSQSHAQAPRAVGGARNGEALFQGADPRGVPQLHPLRVALLRHRVGRASLFGKAAARLTIAEAATLLAALPKGPALYDPARHPDRARERRNLVLTLMAQQRYISAAQASAAQKEPIVTAPNAGLAAPAPYFVDVVRVQAERAGIKVGEGGFRVTTTLDPAIQRAANDALRDGTAEVEGRAGYKHPTYANKPKGTTGYLQGAVVALDPFTGDVRALVGGRDYIESPYNRAVNGMRQPGSAFKPIVYATAVAESIAVNTIIPDTALAIPRSNRTVYRPENADGTFLGPITMREALARSRNPVAVQLAMRVGMDSVIAMARALGISSFIAPYPSSAIGASVVQPLDLVAAYATFANPGDARRTALHREHRGPERHGGLAGARHRTATGARPQGGLHRARHDARCGRSRDGLCRASLRPRRHSRGRQDRDDQ
ncbi:MAG: transglycosylase domain-containing protein [Gemmatimonadetes bacterium]|nr:transglycosylase domain-containing protein [Gemmatimonadota bacterium]